MGPLNQLQRPHQAHLNQRLPAHPPTQPLTGLKRALTPSPRHLRRVPHPTASAVPQHAPQRHLQRPQNVHLQLIKIRKIRQGLRRPQTPAFTTNPPKHRLPNLDALIIAHPLNPLRPIRTQQEQSLPQETIRVPRPFATNPTETLNLKELRTREKP
jgi:hypothetical protein